MNNQEIADKIYSSYYSETKEYNKQEAKKHANTLIDAQIKMMFQDEGNIIIDVDRELYLDDWEEIKYLINLK